MKTAGQTLHQARLSQKIDLQDVSRITRIRLSSLQHIEADDYQKLPSGTVARGFIRNYCEFLHLSPGAVLAVFRRDFVENAAGQIVPRGMVQPVSRISFWTPRTTVIAVVTVIFILFAAYLIYQYRVLTGPPPLKLSRPAADFHTDQDSVEIVGLTDPEATISVNGQLIVLDKGGKFSFRLPLQVGSNTVSVTALSKSGKTTTLTRTVILR